MQLASNREVLSEFIEISGTAISGITNESLVAIQSDAY